MTLDEIREKFRITKDLHTHTIYSRVGPYLHGKGTIMQNARAAHEQGLSELAITDHGPKEFYGLDPRRIPKMREEIAAAQEKYPDLKIWLGVEANIMDTPNGLDVAPDEVSDYDFINAGYHYGVPKCGMVANWLAFKMPLPRAVKEKLSERMSGKNTELALRALRNNDIKILTHPGDKAYFDMAALAAECEKTGTLIEINARHRRPNIDDLRLMAKYSVKFIISSDAHRPKHVGRYVKSLKLALDAGIDTARIVNVEERK